MTIALNCDATPPTAATVRDDGCFSGRCFGRRATIYKVVDGWMAGPPVVPRWVRAMHRILFGRGRPQQCRCGVKRNHSTNSASEEGISDSVTPNGGEQQLLYSPTTWSTTSSLFRLCSPVGTRIFFSRLRLRLQFSKSTKAKNVGAK